MNKNILFIALLGLVTIFSSCNKDEKVAPTVTFVGGAGYTNSDQSVAVGTVIKTGINATCEQTMKKFQVKVSYDGAVASMVLDSAISTKNFSLPSYKFPTRNVAGTEVWSFTLVDDGSLTSTVSFKITTTVTSAAISTYSVRLLGGQNNATLGSSFSTSNGTVYTLDNAKTNSGLIDFVYFFGASNAATISAPNNTVDLDAVFTGSNRPSTWATKNATTFGDGTMTSAQFDLVTNVVGLGTASTTAVKANSLTVGKVIAFTTAAGKRGLFKVTSINNGATGDITIDVKVAQ